MHFRELRKMSNIQESYFFDNISVIVGKLYMVSNN